MSPLTSFFVFEANGCQIFFKFDDPTRINRDDPSLLSAIVEFHKSAARSLEEIQGFKSFRAAVFSAIHAEPENAY